MWCDGCLMVGRHVPATTRSLNPEYAKYAFCEECALKYNVIFLDLESDRQAKKTVHTPVSHFSRHQGGGVFKMKYGGKHYKGCVCDICGSLDGKHTHLCACPYCGGKAGKHNPECHCPQCFGPNGKHNPHCECPVCHRLG